MLRNKLNKNITATKPLSLSFSKSLDGTSFLWFTKARLFSPPTFLMFFLWLDDYRHMTGSPVITVTLVSTKSNSSNTMKETLEWKGVNKDKTFSRNYLISWFVLNVFRHRSGSKRHVATYHGRISSLLLEMILGGATSLPAFCQFAKQATHNLKPGRPLVTCIILKLQHLKQCHWSCPNY